MARRVSSIVMLLACFPVDGAVPLNLANYCKGSTPSTPLEVGPSTVLMLNKGALQTSPCDVTMKALWQTDDGRLRIQVVAINLPCREGNLQIFDGDSISNVSISYPAEICSPDPYQAMYLSTGTMITIRITDQKVTSTSQATMQLLFTSTGYSSQDKKDDFLCTNNLRVDMNLKCDGNNNCGDGSDETYQLCGWCNDYKTAFLTFLGLFLLAMVIIVSFIVFRYRANCKARDDENKPITELGD